MFDDLDKQNAPESSARDSGGESNPPTPLLKGGASAPVKVEDILAEVDRGGKPEAFRPRPANVPPSYGTVIPADDSWLKNKKLIFGSLAGIFVILAGVYFGLMLMKNKTLPESASAPEQPVNQVNNEINAPAAPEDAPANPQTLGVPGTPSVSADTDQDGLTDEEESALGANPNDPDSDQDGLTDREEVKVYLTDLLKPDTDGDGYPDGTEVKNGYDPKGPGKLLEIKP
ncbi:MAG: hypothetical protein Q7R92_00830 [bacterium]|nr:hypothetical protein [bacterium]